MYTKVVSLLELLRKLEVISIRAEMKYMMKVHARERDDGPSYEEVELFRGIHKK